MLEILARATAKTERTRSGNTGKTVVPPNMGAGKRGTIRVGKDDPVTYTPPAPAPSREAGSDTETDEDNSFASGRRNFGRRATLVFLPQKARPSEEAYERARIHGVELYAYISRKPGKGQGPRDLFIPPDGQHFLVSHLPYDAMLEHTNSLVNMYGGPSDVEIRVSTYRQATPASNPVEAS